MKLFFFAGVMEIMSDVWTQFIAMAPRLIYFLVILFCGFIIAKVVSGLVKKLLKGLKVDSIGERLTNIDLIQKSNFSVNISSLFSKIVYYLIFLFFLVVATEVLQIPAVSDIVKGIFNFLPKVIVALIIVIIGLLFAEAVRAVIKTACDSMNIPSSNLISMFVFYFIVINVFISALSQASVNTNFLSQNLSIIIGGIILAFSIGYGLASKDIVANFLASYYSRDFLNVGDKISIDGQDGEIIEIDRTSVTIDIGDRLTVYPLSHFSKNKFEKIK